MFCSALAGVVFWSWVDGADELRVEMSATTAHVRVLKGRVLRWASLAAYTFLYHTTYLASDTL